MRADSAPLGPLEGILGLHIRMAHGAVYRHFSETFADLGLSQKQVSVLWLAADRPGIGQSDLAKLLQMDRATTMAIVHAIEKRGLLAREPVAGDARRIGLTATDKGVATLAVAREAIATHEEWLKARFNDAEIAQFMALLRRVHG